jgi:cation:H+ antiporter
MNIWLAVTGLLLTFYLLKIVSDQVENSFSALAFRYKIPATIAGATLLAVGGSAGELFTALNSAIFYKTFEIGLITIIWSAIFNLFVITGLIGIKTREKIPLSKKGMIRDMIFYFLSAFTLTLAIMDGEISQVESFGFLAMYAIYLAILYTGKNDNSKLEKLEENHQPMLKIVIVSFLGLAGIAFLSWAMIKFGLTIAKFAGLSIAAVSAIFFAFGTSISDTFIAISAAKKGNGSGAISSVFGSNTFDILIGLGLPIAIIGGVPINVDGIFSSIVMLFLSIFVAVIFIAKDWHLSRKEGYALLTTFFIFLGYFLFL